MAPDCRSDQFAQHAIDRAACRVFWLHAVPAQNWTTKQDCNLCDSWHVAESQSKSRGIYIYIYQICFTECRSRSNTIGNLREVRPWNYQQLDCWKCRHDRNRKSMYYLAQIGLCLVWSCRLSQLKFQQSGCRPCVAFLQLLKTPLPFYFLRENKAISFLEVFAEFSSNGEEKSRKFLRLDVE